MDAWTIVYIVVLVLAFLGLRRLVSQHEGSEDAKPLTVKSELGFGIIALGVLTFIMPMTAGKIAAFDFIASDQFAILMGSTLVMGVLVILAGVAVLIAKDNTE